MTVSWRSGTTHRTTPRRKRAQTWMTAIVATAAWTAAPGVAREETWRVLALNLGTSRLPAHYSGRRVSHGIRTAGLALWAEQRSRSPLAFFHVLSPSESALPCASPWPSEDAHPPRPHSAQVLPRPHFTWPAARLICPPPAPRATPSRRRRRGNVRGARALRFGTAVAGPRALRRVPRGSFCVSRWPSSFPCAAALSRVEATRQHRPARGRGVRRRCVELWFLAWPGHRAHRGAVALLFLFPRATPDPGRPRCSPCLHARAGSPHWWSSATRQARRAVVNRGRPARPGARFWAIPNAAAALLGWCAARGTRFASPTSPEARQRAFRLARAPGGSPNPTGPPPVTLGPHRSRC